MVITIAILFSECSDCAMQDEATSLAVTELSAQTSISLGPKKAYSEPQTPSSETNFLAKEVYNEPAPTILETGLIFGVP